jgi:hypothetical protein
MVDDSLPITKVMDSRSFVNRPETKQDGEVKQIPHRLDAGLIP